MTISISTGTGNVLTAALAAALAGGSIRIFAGVRPTSTDAAETGTLLGVVTVGSVPGAGLHFTASGQTLYKADEPWVFKAIASGTAAWFRVVGAADPGGASVSAPRIDGSIGTPAAPGDMTWQTAAVEVDLHYTIDSFLYLLQPIGN